MSDPLSVLYVCYGSLEDPLVQTQVVAYLEGLAQSGHLIHLLTFDGPLVATQKHAFRADLKGRGIEWHTLRYHKRPSLPATLFDILAGAVFAVRLVRRDGLDAVHARNHVPALMGLITRWLTGCRLIFDLRGLMAEEYADAGLWKRGGVVYRLTQQTQRLALSSADAVTLRTEAVRTYLTHGAIKSDRTAVIPACADVGPIRRDAAGHPAVRKELGLGDRPVLVYVGKFTGWYMEHEMAQYFSAARRYTPDLVFLIVTQADPAPMLQALDRFGIQVEDYRVVGVPPDQLGRYLAVAEYGISFVRPCQSKIASSPTKVAEYLAAGLPVLSSSGIGDLDTLLAENRVGVLLERFSEAGYRDAWREISKLASEPDIRERCRGVASSSLSLTDVGIPQYERLYQRVKLGR